MSAREIYESWLNCNDLDESLKKELEAIKGDEHEIEERFYRELEFGTAGLRGVLGAGTNRMNIYTVAKATQGLADYINAQDRADKSVAIAYDSRHMSVEFAEISASVLNANGIKTYVFDALRPTPELSFAIRYLKCIAGINITASHNPAKYNGYKVYWEDGAQITEPVDQGITDSVAAVKDMLSMKQMPKDEAVSKGLYVEIGKEVDEAFMDAVYKTVREPELLKEIGPQINIVYTPLHGAGIMIVPELLKRAGITNIHIVKEQEKPDGAFPTVEYPNPEVKEALKLAKELAIKVDADLVIGTDPDSDRMGIMVRDSEGNFQNLTGNMVGSILCEYELSRAYSRGELTPDSYIVRSIVSSNMADLVAANYGVQVREVLTGFKWIGREILKSETTGEGKFIFGFEESCGYLAGDYARDKDACGAALSISEACAYYKSQGMSLWDVSRDMFKRYGFVKEETISITREGQEGLREIAGIMEKLRNDPFKEIAGYPVVQFRDFKDTKSTGFPPTNALYYTLENGWVCVRPSGTEPKIKYYVGVRRDTDSESSDMLKEIKDFLLP